MPRNLLSRKSKRVLTARSLQPCPSPTLSPHQEKHLHVRNLLRVDQKKHLTELARM